MGAVAWAFGYRLVSHPRSSNRTCRFPASGFPAGFTARHATGPLRLRLSCSHSTVISADRWPDNLLLSDIEPGFVCTAYGRRGADIRTGGSA
jgi:hypothetical protein